MTIRRGKGPDPNDDLANLSDDDVEKRLGGGAGLGGPVAPRPAADPTPPAPPSRGGGRGGVLWRDVGLVLVLLLILAGGARVVLTDNSTAQGTPTPGTSQVAVASPTEITQPPTPTPSPQPTPTSAQPSDVIGSLEPEVTPTPVPTPTPTPSPTPTPTPAPGQTPKPTPKPTPTPPPTTTLKVFMQVNNQWGGSRGPGDWTVHVTGASASPSSFPGTAQKNVTVRVGQAFTVTVNSLSGYGTTKTGDCATSLGLGVIGQCTIQANDQPAYVTAVTQVTGGGSPSDFHVVLDATNAQPSSHTGSSAGFTYLFNPGSYSLSVSDLNGYTPDYSSGCSGTGTAGITSHCTISLTAPTAPTTSIAPQLGFVGPGWLALLLRPRRRRDRGLRPGLR